MDYIGTFWPNRTFSDNIAILGIASKINKTQAITLVRPKRSFRVWEVNKNGSVPLKSQVPQQIFLANVGIWYRWYSVGATWSKEKKSRLFFHIRQNYYSSFQTRFSSRRSMPESRIRQKKSRNFAFRRHLFRWQNMLPSTNVGIRFYVLGQNMSYSHEGFYLKIDVGIGIWKVSTWFHFYRTKSGLGGGAYVGGMT